MKHPACPLNARCLALACVLLAGACTEPSDRYQGISEPPKNTPRQSPATRPSVPADGGAGAVAAPGQDDVDSPGTVFPTSPPLDAGYPRRDS